MNRPIEYVAVARVEDVPPGSLVQVQAGDRWYALANLDGQFYALDNNCPHQGGPLGKGRLVEKHVECPWHCWSWELATGRSVWPGSSAFKARTVPVRVEGGKLLLPVI